MRLSGRHSGPAGLVASLRRAGAWLTSVDVRERLVALLLLVLVALGAGMWLGHSADRLDELPGLLLMVPAAIALRGNIFGALGARLGTSIHAGTFRLSLRPSTVVGENVLASAVLTLVTSVLLAVLAKLVAVVFGVADAIPLFDFVTISVLGGLLASVIVLATALALTAGSVRFGWDPDNVTAPLVTAAGDVATIPALVVAAGLAGGAATGWGVGIVAVALVAGFGVWAVRAGQTGLTSILRESIPVLVFAIVIDLIAGVTVEKQLASFTKFPALLVLFPAFLAVAGALGGTLSSRLATGLHLGTIEPTPIPQTRARSGLVESFGLAVPVFVVCGALAHLFSVWTSLDSPGLVWLVAAALLGGLLANLLSSLAAYYTTISSVRAGLDPDTWGIPMVTSTVDLLGAFTLILAIEVLGFV